MRDLYTPQSWEEAKKIASLVGTVPGTFSACIRFLRRDAEQNKNEVGPVSRYCLARLLKSRSFKSPVYYCARTFRNDQLEALGPVTPRALLEVFRADEYALIVALIYLYRKVMKGCKEDEFATIATPMHLYAEVGGHLGQALPAIGFYFGLLSGAIRHLAMAMFLGIDLKRYVTYRRNVKRKDAIFDLEAEFNTWGCTHAQVASILTQPLGLGKETGDALALGLSSMDDRSVTDTREGAAVQMAWLWVSALVKHGKPPDVVHNARFYPLPQELDKLLVLSNQLRESGSKHRWISRGKADISPDDLPSLFEDEQPTAAQSEITAETAKVIPKEMLQELGNGEIAELEDEGKE